MTETKVPEASSLAKFYCDYLTETGYRPEIGEAGSVVFMHEGHSYIIAVDQSDEEYLRVISAFRYPIDSQEEYHHAVRTCMKITENNKAIKIYALEEPSSFMISAESFLASHEDAKKVIPRNIRTIQGCLGEFLKTMKEWLTSDLNPNKPNDNQ